MTKTLILGGTREAAKLALKLCKEGHDVTTSLAGRTKEPMPVQGNTRIGGFGGIEGLVKYLQENHIETLIDATHPFAKQISANAAEAAKRTGIKFEILTRPPWKKQHGDEWIEVNSLEEARDAIPTASRVLLALGSQHIGLFSNRNDVFYLVRMIDKPVTPLGLPSHELLLGKPSAECAEELATLKAHEITHIVCRNSGGSGAYAKIEAARELGIPVIIVTR